jgi:beta-lactamase regulating signal transducer with metallopeptidase domain
MIAALALLLGASAAGWLIPRRLGRIDLRHRDPLLMIVCWLTSMAGVALAAATGVILLLLPGHGGIGSLVGVLHHCWSAVQHGSPPQVEQLGGMLGVVVLAATAVRLTVVGIRVCRRRVHAGREHLALLRVAAHVDEGSPITLWLPHDSPLAFSVAGHPGAVVATEGLTRHLTAEAVAAVLAHERAHLRGRHHLLIAIVDALSAVLPFVPLFRRAPAVLRELAELAADVAAVRTCGVAAVEAALRGVARHDTPDIALAMAGDAIDTRLARLRHPAAAPGRIRRATTCSAAGTIAALVPFLTAAGLLVAIAMVACPMTGS